MYTLVLEKDDYESVVSFHEPRGYAADFTKHATEIVENEADGSVLLRFSECDAWAFAEQVESDGEAFGACMSEEVLIQFMRFLGSIV